MNPKTCAFHAIQDSDLKKPSPHVTPCHIDFYIFFSPISLAGDSGFIYAIQFPQATVSFRVHFLNLMLYKDPSSGGRFGLL